MARVLFAQGVRGEIVRSIQRRLAARGFDPKGIDGGYGTNTRTAVRAFQQQNGIQPTGEVSVPTWRKLMSTPIPPVRDRALQLIAAFEGHDFTLAQGNFDGAGITWGIIGFTLQGGELSRIILQIQDGHPALVRQAFGAKADQLVEIMRGPKTRQMAFANTISLGPSKARLAEPWRTGFRVFGELPAVQALQLELAARDYFRPAKQTARGLRLKTELGLALAFDCHVQNGGVSTAAREEIKRQLGAASDRARAGPPRDRRQRRCEAVAAPVPGGRPFPQARNRDWRGHGARRALHAPQLGPRRCTACGVTRASF